MQVRSKSRSRRAPLRDFAHRAAMVAPSLLKATLKRCKNPGTERHCLQTPLLKLISSINRWRAGKTSITRLKRANPERDGAFRTVESWVWRPIPDLPDVMEVHGGKQQANGE